MENKSVERSFKPFRRIVIEHYAGPTITDFADLRKHYGTGQAYLISSNPEKKYGYRYGIQCDIGDVEESEWRRLVEELIERSGEQKLFSQILEWEKLYGFSRNAKEVKQHALELHCARLFDNKNWHDYINFNQKYRPEILRNETSIE